MRPGKRFTAEGAEGAERRGGRVKERDNLIDN
jgi:hypothetical protein